MIQPLATFPERDHTGIYRHAAVATSSCSYLWDGIVTSQVDLLTWNDDIHWVAMKIRQQIVLLGLLCRY